MKKIFYGLMMMSLFFMNGPENASSFAEMFGISKSEARVVVAGRRPVGGAVVVGGGIRVLPRGCVFRGGIYVCGTVRYRPVIQNGVTVYIVI